MKFKVISEFKPKGDQPNAINEIVKNFNYNCKNIVLQGVTGSGKTFTMANVIEKLNKPTLVLAHNKTLAAQLYSEFKTFQKMQLNILFHIMTIINLKHICNYRNLYRKGFNNK